MQVCVTSRSEKSEVTDSLIGVLYRSQPILVDYPARFSRSASVIGGGAEASGRWVAHNSSTDVTESVRFYIWSIDYGEVPGRINSIIAIGSWK